MDNYKVIENKLRNLESFNGNSMTAKSNQTNSRFEYKIYSYNTLIAETVWDGSEGEWFTWVNPNKYSVTTSRHQNIIKRVWKVA